MLAKNIYSASEIFQSNMPMKWKERQLKKTMNYYCEPRSERHMKDKLSMADIISEQLPMNKGQKVQLKYMLEKDFPDLKKLHRTIDIKKIICILCFFIMKNDNPDCKLSKYKVFNANNISNDDVAHIFFKLAAYYRQKTPL